MYKNVLKVSDVILSYVSGQTDRQKDKRITTGKAVRPRTHQLLVESNK